MITQLKQIVLYRVGKVREGSLCQRAVPLATTTGSTALGTLARHGEAAAPRSGAVADLPQTRGLKDLYNDGGSYHRLNRRCEVVKVEL